MDREKFVERMKTAVPMCREYIARVVKDSADSVTDSNPRGHTHLIIVMEELAELAQRADNYAYIRDVWGLETKASACCFCPFHTNYFFKYLHEKEPETYQKLKEVDELLRLKNPKPPMDSDLFISRSRKRISDLTCDECADGEFFTYRGKQIWNGF